MEMKSYNAKGMRIFSFLLCAWFLISSLGCEAFVRKFTRKKTKENMPAEEIVIEPEEYRNTMTKEELYRQYFVFWKSWQDELIESLLQHKSYNKKRDCIEQAVKNLEKIKAMLNEDKKKSFDKYVQQARSIQANIINDIYGVNDSFYRQEAERLRRDVLQYFSYSDIKDFLI